VREKISLEGRARVLGSDVNTDYIISSSRKKETVDPKVLRHYLLETVDPAFAASVRPGDLIVAGRNFGCGSAMEVAVTVITASGVRGVLAPSFARTYYRNAINNGLVPVECDTSGIDEGHLLTVTITDGRTEIEDRTSGLVIGGGTLPHFALEILRAGGLVPHVLKHRGLQEYL